MLLYAALATGLYAQSTRLKVGKTLRGQVSGAETRGYTVAAKANWYFRVGITPSGSAVAVELRAPDGSKVLDTDSRAFPARPTRVVAVTERAGQQRIVLSAVDKSAGAAQYEIKLEEMRRATADDRKRAEGERLSAQGLAQARSFAYDQAISTYMRTLELFREVRDGGREGDTLVAIASAHSSLGQNDKATGYYEQALSVYGEARDRAGEGVGLQGLGFAYVNLSQNQRAVSYYEQALAIDREVKNRPGEVAALNGLGNAYRLLSQNEKAISYFEQALAICRELKDRQSEGVILNGLANSYVRLSQNETAIGYYEQALAILRELKNRRSEANCLNGLGNAYNNLGRTEEAIEYFEQALAIRREIKDRLEEGGTLNNLGISYILLSQNEKAISYFEQSLVIRREVKDRRGEGTTLTNLALAHLYLNQYEKSIGYNEEALALTREVKDQRGEGDCLTNLGNAYDDLGQFDKAIGYHEQALKVHREIGDRADEALDLDSLGLSYQYLGQSEKAIGYYEQALAIARAVKNRGGEGVFLSNLGQAYASLSQFKRAIEYYGQALAIQREVKNRLGEGEDLNNLGDAFHALGENQKAIEYFVQALAISRGVKDRRAEAAELAGLMETWQASSEPRLAIFYGKQVVNVTQSIRSEIRGLGQDVQRSYLKGNEAPYHTLAELLIAQGRLAEAEQVLALLKEEEYFQYIRRDGEEASSLNRRADLTAEEAEWQKRYDAIGGQLMAIGAERAALLAKKTLSEEDTRRLTALDRDITVGNQKFQQFLGELAEHFSAKLEAHRRIAEIQETQGIMEDLRDLPEGTVAIFTLAAQDKFYAILRTTDAQKAYEYPIKAADLNRKIADFRQAAEDPRIDPRPLGQELYQILVGGMAQDLRQAKAKTLMWSLDGALRYVPLAALYDGQQYLIEQYRVSVMTLASSTRLKDRPDPEWRAVGFGVTKAYGGSPALPFVSSELAAIIATGSGHEGVMQGDIRLDDEFTRDSMQQELLRRFPVVHIASHFRFSPGDDAKSFLLLGDGGHFSLAELKISANLFGGVQLLTLSACNTGVGDGTEVEGFGTLAQRQGAKAVIASLWAVMDESTSHLMQEFYRIRESSPDITKVEALREAQLELLRGTGQFSGMTRGVSVNPAAERPGAPRFPTDPKALFAHPYFWAPFFLMGNWL